MPINENSSENLPPLKKYTLEQDENTVDHALTNAIRKAGLPKENTNALVNLQQLHSKLGSNEKEWITDIVSNKYSDYRNTIVSSSASLVTAGLGVAFALTGVGLPVGLILIAAAAIATIFTVKNDLSFQPRKELMAMLNNKSQLEKLKGLNDISKNLLKEANLNRKELLKIITETVKAPETTAENVNEQVSQKIKDIADSKKMLSKTTPNHEKAEKVNPANTEKGGLTPEEQATAESTRYNRSHPAMGVGLPGGTNRTLEL